ncbi:transmembrane 9 superfamily member 1 isoform X3 [Phycodurus eques]|uniref:transmembrane 9 superfamily member 1 isoform X3 n=1 Tax=Phycodurus eques TaxID=693459 RepID=UPI002ACDF3EC|nr:transmembrane 9 superfamily member 1 isoform X3 [Phycodurus eques]
MASLLCLHVSASRRGEQQRSEEGQMFGFLHFVAMAIKGVMHCRRGHSPGSRQRTMSPPRVLALCFLTAVALGYKQGDNVTVYVNKVGPYHNPQETYHFYTLPVCRPDKVHHKSLSLGEVLDGDRMAESLYHIRFRENVEKKTLCQLTLSEKQVDQLREAIEELYYFEFVLDDIPIWGFVGYIEESGFLPHSHKVGLWTHLDFNIEYNGDSVIFANVSVKEVKPVPLEDGAGAALGGVGVGGGSLTVIHTYSVRWFESPLTHARRAERLRDYSFFPKTLEIHWLSIINSLVLVVLLLGFVIIILMRVLKNDFARYNVEEEAGCDDLDQGDNGWKIIHTDVFRFPPYKSLLCAVLGVGAQFLTLATAPLFLTWSVVNSVHWWSGSTQALPATTVLLLLGAWVSVGFPLTVIGGIVGKNRAGGFQAPCRTRNIPRQIPPQPWYKHAAVHMAIGGFLPFSAISVELYYIFATVWGREHYTLYGILLCVFAILLSVGACISVALTYFLLSGEDYRWWWRSVLSTGSTGLFIFVYSVFYYRNRSSMSGLVQSTEFFGYSLLTALVFSLMLGSVSFWASLAFIRYIYRSLKMD